ncbi:XkdX family protein [Clostridium sp. BL-8]|nr:XkdX family protein [Clostridium sp. BL-8]OOM75509.1 hypothetical protein CLOBL_39990 [Clostridium sp. BL-8]
MDWFEFCRDYFIFGIANGNNLKIYVVKNKITDVQYKEITGIDYVV